MEVNKEEAVMGEGGMTALEMIKVEVKMLRFHLSKSGRSPQLRAQSTGSV